MKFFCTLLTLFICVCGFSQAETEPNNSFETANPLNINISRTATVNSTTDEFDYYRAVLPLDGTLKIYVQATNTSSSAGYLYMYGYDRRKANGQVFGEFIGTSNTAAGTSIKDTITVNGRAADTFYIRLQSTQSFSYSVTYEMVDTSENDVEPNNTFDQALLINHLQEKSGHIGYVANGTDDASDYYKTVFPYDGTLKIFVKATNNGANNGYLFMYGYDRRKANGQVISEYISSTNTAKGATIYDTITVNGRAADTFYYRLLSTQAFSYSFKYEIVDTSENDAEPNDTFDEALAINTGQEKKGHIGYAKNGTTDQYDYYQAILPIDGTLKIYVEGTNTGVSNGYLYMYGYDRRKANGQVFGTYISGSSNISKGVTIIDSIIVTGVLADTFYFRVQSSVAFKYKLRYVVSQNSPFDEEPNNTFEQAIPFNQGITKNGQIGYQSGGITDNFDYYSTVLPTDGTLKVYVKGTNNSSTAGYLYMYGYDRRKAAGQMFGEYIKSTSTAAGTTIFDTILLKGRAADTFYFRLQSTQAFSYSFSYDIVDTSQNDVEPNNTFESSLAINYLEEKTGHINYAANGTADAFDYYKAVLPTDGTLKVYVKGTNNSASGGYLYMYGYDRRKAAGQMFGEYIKSTNTAAGATIFDTITVYGRAADTVYFRLQATQAFNYSFKYEVVDTSENDIEPNNTFAEALSINQLQIKVGHIGYVNNGANDASDYYKTALAADGTVKIYVEATNQSGANGYLYIYGYDARKSTGQVLGAYITGSSSVAAGKTLYDTLLVSCLAADSFFFRIVSAGAFKYRLSYDQVNTSPNYNDVEPNNTFLTAIKPRLDSSILGHIGYQIKGISDNVDYYALKLPSRGAVNIIVEATNTSTGNSSLRLTGFRSRFTTQPLVDKFLSNSSSIPRGATIKDTITINCLTIDTLYLVFAATGCFRYSFNTSFISLDPSADMTYEQLGHTVGFRPQLANATSFRWSFGDGDTSILKYPMKTYKPGVYTARLIAANSTCNYRDTATTQFSVAGVEYFTPNKTGRGGDIIMQVFGGGLDSTTEVLLARGSDTLRPVGVYTNSLLNNLSAEFNLHLVASGYYDVHIKVPGQPLASYPNGLLVDTFRYPVTSAEVQGPTRWRTNSNTIFKLVVSNSGNVSASGVVIGFAWPKDVNVTFKNKFIEPPTGVESVIVEGKTYSLNRSEYKFIYDNLNTVVAIDSFNMKPFKGFMQYILLPHVPAGSTVELPFTAKTTVTGKPAFKTFTYIPNQRGSCETPNFNDYHADVTAEMIDAIGTVAGDKNIPLKALVVTAKIGQKHAGSATAYASKRFWAWYDGYEYDGDAAMQDWMEETEANNAFALQTATDELGNLLFDAGAAKLVKKYGDQVEFINKRLANNPNMSPELFDKYIDKLNSIPSTERLEALTAMYKTTKDAASLSNKLLLLQKLADDCPELQPQVDKLKEELDKEINQRNNKEKSTNSVTSLDPNEINGPVGVGENRYLNNVDRHSFTVNFENVDTAKASAQIVMVKDTLDKTKYDLATFEFGGITIGENYYRLPKGRQQFVIERNVVDQPLSVRINGSLDTASGIIEWQFTSIDTITKQLPVFDGFLPPNVSKPQGEGSVSYSVKPFTTLSDGTVFTNRASIIFDTNDPILTNTWQNILDIGKSTSTLSASVVQDTVIKLRFTGTDAVSGVGYYNLYASVNDGAFIPFGGTSADTLTMIGSVDSTYKFYVISEDKVGNRENKAGTAETTVTITQPLPITLLTLSAENVGDRNRILWATATEEKGETFLVEKSTNGRNFSQMATVPAKGNPSNYITMDNTPAKGRTWYRLKLVNADGKYSYSKVVSAYMVTKGQFVMEAYPNPVSSQLNITLHGTIEGRGSVAVFDMMGRQVMQTPISRNTFTLDVSNQPKGNYIVNYADDKNVEIIKITKN